ncbi:MAG: hypothetical protein GY720_15915 [bacterium]|nr:hypothetical protein [bacterium]
MGTWTIPGPVIDKDNTILRTVRLASESDRARSVTDWNRVRVGVRDGAYVSYIGSWDQSSNKIDQGNPRPLLGARRKNMRLRSGQQIIIEMKDAGSPSDPTDMAVTLQLALDGARTGRRRPLIKTGGGSSLADRINESGMHERKVRIPITAEPS